MTTAHISLTDEEKEKLSLLSRSTGKSEEELLGEVVREFLKPEITSEAMRKQATRQQQLEKAEGIWKDRDDLPNLAELRKEWDRFDRA